MLKLIPIKIMNSSKMSKWNLMRVRYNNRIKKKEKKRRRE